MATWGLFGGKSHRHRRLVKQRQLKTQYRRKRKAEVVTVSVLSKVLLKLRLIVMSTYLEYRERQRKRESRRHASEAQREMERQTARARDKIQRRHFFVGRTTWKFCSDGDKMRNASGHQCKVKMSGSDKKVNENTYDTSSIKRVTKKFLRVFTLYSCKTTAKKCTKKCAARAKLLFC